MHARHPLFSRTFHGKLSTGTQKKKINFLEMTTREVKRKEAAPTPDRTKAVESNATPVKSGRPKTYNLVFIEPCILVIVEE